MIAYNKGLKYEDLSIAFSSVLWHAFAKPDPKEKKNYIRRKSELAASPMSAMQTPYNLHDTKYSKLFRTFYQ